MINEFKATHKSNNMYLGWGIFIFIILGLTLPFHYIPSRFKMFPKDHFTFKHTIITEDDLDDIVKRYNDATNIFERNAMNNDPFLRTLKEQGIIYDKDRKDIYDENYR